MDFIEEVCKKTDSDGKSYLIKFMNFSADCLLKGVNPLTN